MTLSPPTPRPVPPRSRRALRVLVLYALNEQRRTLSYQQGWPKAFRDDPRFDATLANVMTRSGRLAARWAVETRAYETIVILHSVLSNEGVIFGPLLDAIRAHPAPKAYFIGNEYKLMPQKMEFSEAVGVSLLLTMTANERVHRLYSDRLGCLVAHIPSAGLDPKVFFPTTERRARPIDLGMRAFDEPLTFGHQERRAIATHFADRSDAYALRVDISFDSSQRFRQGEYAAFLNRCRGQLGTEGGTDFFELTDELYSRVYAHLSEHPDATLADLRPRFFADYRDPVPCRMISGRHAEAAGTRTTQILFEGGYDGGLFQPDVHYIALRKDFSNVDDVLAKFRDDAYSDQIADNAYELALAELTYERLLTRFLNAAEPLLPGRALRRSTRR